MGIHEMVQRQKLKQRALKLTEKVRAQKRRKIVQRLRDSEGVSDDDVALLESLAHEGCTVEQSKVVAQVLRRNTPWGILDVVVVATEQQCISAYRRRLCLIHPDKCKHPGAKEVANVNLIKDRAST